MASSIDAGLNSSIISFVEGSPVQRLLGTKLGLSGDYVIANQTS
jgi:hypothetical protein